MKRLAIAAALALGHLGLACTRLGERIVHRATGTKLERKPPARVEEPPPRTRGWRMPTAEEIDRARGFMVRDEYQAASAICRGPHKGCTLAGRGPCDDCFRIAWHDQRSSAEILQAMERGDG